MKISPRISIASFWLITLAVAFSIGYSIKSSTSKVPQLSPINPNSSERNFGIPNQDLASNKSEINSAESTMSTKDALNKSSNALIQEFSTALKLPATDPRRAARIIASLKELAAIDPQQALVMSAQIESLRDRERADRAILEVWASYAPIDALAWAETALAGETRQVRNAKLDAIYRGFALMDPLAAYQSANLLSQETRNDARMRTRILQNIIETQIENGGLTQARALIEAMPEGSDRASLMEEMIDGWASYDPKNAASYILALGDQASERVKISLVDEWSESDPAAAAAWLSSLSPDDPAIARGAAEIIREWSRYDLNASAEWLNSLPASPELDRAVASYTFQAAQEDPASAMSWAESISSDNFRNRMMERVAAEWKSSDAKALENYINSSGLTDEQKESLRSAEPGRGFGRGRPR